MKNVFLVTMMASVLTACPGSNPVCETGKILAKPLSVAMAQIADCKVPSELESWMTEQLVILKVCSPPTGIGANGYIGDIVCPLVVDRIIGVGISKLPAKAQCSGGKIADGAKEKLMAVCKGAI
jgi:hypothetical protein